MQIHEVKILQIHNARREFVKKKKKKSRLLTNQNPAFLHKVLLFNKSSLPGV